MAASESYPDDLLYNPEHDWARIEGDEAVLGITWYAHDALGELVHYEPPAVGATVAKGELVRRGRVGEGRLGPDRAALGRGARGEPEGRRRARDRERGPVRRGLADPHPADDPSERDVAARRRRLPQRGRRRSELPLAHGRRPRRRCSRRSASRRSRSSSATSRPACASAASSTCRRRSPRPSSRGTSRSSRRRTSSTRSRSSAPASTTTTCRRSSTRCSSAASS